MNIRYINRTDLVVIAISMLNLLLLSINVKLSSVILLYFSDLAVLGALTYWAIFKDATNTLRRSLIIGGIAGFLYTFVDSFFAEVHIINYLKLNDIKILATPISIVLLWAYFIATMIYLYQRLRSMFGEFYIPSLLTGAGAFLLGFVLNYLGNYARLWIWSIWQSSSPSIGPMPLFVPTAFFLTFLLSPYIVGTQRGSIETRQDSSWAKFFRPSDNPIFGGIRCTIVLSATLFLLLRFFTMVIPYYH